MNNSDMKTVTVFLVDDHQLIREMWTQLFAGHMLYEVVGECGEFNPAIEMIKERRPEIVLLDINLQNMSGLDAVPLIRKYSPGTKIIAVSMHNQPAYAKKMLQLGAKGYVTKNSSRQEIFEAIEQALNGKTYVCEEIKESLFDQMPGCETREFHRSNLSIREMEIIKLIKTGLTSREIAANLCISVRTAEVHRYNIFRKMKLKNTASLLNYINTTHLPL